jgi:hypothetical protein
MVFSRRAGTGRAAGTRTHRARRRVFRRTLAYRGGGFRFPAPTVAPFAEAAAALTIAYLAIEILVLPAARLRWLVVALPGVLHGTYFEMLIAAGDYRPFPYPGGVLTAEILVLLAIALAIALPARVAAPKTAVFERALASALFVAGLAWFGLRLYR